MSVTLEAGFNDDIETKTDFSIPRDPLRFGGRETNQELALNSTDEKTRKIVFKTLKQQGGSIEAGIHIKTGPGKGIQTDAYFQGRFNDNNENYVKINANIDKQGNTDINIATGVQFGKKQG